MTVWVDLVLVLVYLVLVQHEQCVYKFVLQLQSQKSWKVYGVWLLASSVSLQKEDNISWCIKILFAILDFDRYIVNGVWKAIHFAFSSTGSVRVISGVTPVKSTFPTILPALEIMSLGSGTRIMSPRGLILCGKRRLQKIKSWSKQLKSWNR